VTHAPSPPASPLPPPASACDLPILFAVLAVLATASAWLFESLPWSYPVSNPAEKDAPSPPFNRARSRRRATFPAG